MKKQKSGFTIVGTAFSTISNWAGILSYLGISVAAVLAFLKKYALAILLVVIAIIVLILIHLCKKYRASIIKFILRQFAPNSPYRFTKWEAIYEYTSMNTMAFRTRYTVKAMQAGVDHIRVRFNWSGATDTNPIKPKPAKTSGCTTQRIEFAGDEYGYKYYNVFNRTAFNKGEQDVKLGVDIEDMRVSNKKEVSHHLLSSISVVTDTLQMIVVLPSNIYPNNIIAHEYLHATDETHWRDCSTECTVERRDDGKWKVSWEIDKPVFGGKYIIYWNPEVSS